MTGKLVPATKTTNVQSGNWSCKDTDQLVLPNVQRRLPTEAFDAHDHIYRLEDMRIEPPHFTLGRSKE